MRLYAAHRVRIRNIFHRQGERQRAVWQVIFVFRFEGVKPVAARHIVLNTAHGCLVALVFHDVAYAETAAEKAEVGAYAVARKQVAQSCRIVCRHFFIA